MVAEAAIKTDSEHMELMRRLIAARGIERFGLYLLTSENKYTPTGYEEMSGYAIDPAGRAHFFWVGWDDVKQEEAFTVWQNAKLPDGWRNDEEFTEAFAAASGTITDLINQAGPITANLPDSAQSGEDGGIKPAEERSARTLAPEPAETTDALRSAGTA